MDSEEVEGLTWIFGPGFLAGASCCLAALTAIALHFQAPWWAAISAWIVSNPDPTAVRKKGVMRVIGTIAGAIVGYYIAAWTAGRPVAQGFSIFLIATVGTYMRFRSNYGYSWILGTVTSLMILLESLNPPVLLYEVAHFRAYEIIVGVLTALLMHNLIGPILGMTNPMKSQEVRQGDSFDPGVARNIMQAAFIAGLTSVIIPILWSAFNLPSLSQSMITALVLIDPNPVSTRNRAGQRLLGCFIGGIAGLMGCIYAGDSLFLWITVFMAGTMVFSHLHLGRSRWAYVGTQGGVAFIMTLVTGFGPPSTLLPVGERLAGVLIGIAVIIMVAVVVRFIADHPVPTKAPSF